MRDPYDVLGLNRNASEEEIKQKHRELAKKYHPDRYQGNPLSDLAEEKLSEINQAYDELMRGFKGSTNNGKNTTSNNPMYMEIRRALDRNDLHFAETQLNAIYDRSAEWYFLSGMLAYKKGWMDEAVSKIQHAVSMDPSNKEYQTVLNQMVGLNGYYYNANRRGYGYGTENCCSNLACFCCLDSICDCI